MKFWFDNFFVDAEAGVLSENGEHVPLKPIHVAVLTFLISKRPGFVSTREVLEAIWPTEGAQDGYVTTAVTEIRKCLRDSRSTARYVRSRYRRGYAFVFPDVKEDDSSAVESTPETRSYGVSATRAISAGTVLDTSGAFERCQRIEGLKVDRGVALNALDWA